VEEHFYLIWPFIVKFTSPRRLPLVLLGTIPFSILSRSLVLWSGHGVGVFTPCRIDALGLGSLLVLVVQDTKWLRVVSYWAPRALLLLLPVGAGGLYLLSGSALPQSRLGSLEKRMIQFNREDPLVTIS